MKLTKKKIDKYFEDYDSYCTTMHEVGYYIEHLNREEFEERIRSDKNFRKEWAFLTKEDKEKLNKILSGYSWVKVGKYEEPKSSDVDWEKEYQLLKEHHKKETEFLIDKCRELTKYIIENK